MNWRARSGVKLEPRSHNEVSSRVSRGIWGQVMSRDKVKRIAWPL